MQSEEAFCRFTYQVVRTLPPFLLLFSAQFRAFSVSGKGTNFAPDTGYFSRKTDFEEGPEGFEAILPPNFFAFALLPANVFNGHFFYFVAFF